MCNPVWMGHGHPWWVSLSAQLWFFSFSKSVANGYRLQLPEFHLCITDLSTLQFDSMVWSRQTAVTCTYIHTVPTCIVNVAYMFVRVCAEVPKVHIRTCTYCYTQHIIVIHYTAALPLQLCSSCFRFTCVSPTPVQPPGGRAPSVWACCVDEGDEANGSAGGQSGAVQGASAAYWRNRVRCARGCISRPCVPRPPCAMLACTIVKNFKVILNLHICSHNCSMNKTFGLWRSLSVKKIVLSTWSNRLALKYLLHVCSTSLWFYVCIP